MNEDKIKIIKLYKNGTIRLPQEIINKLNLKHNDKLAIECKRDGFVVCNIKNYSRNWTDRFDKEWREFDIEIRRMFTKRINMLNKKEEKTGVL